MRTLLVLVAILVAAFGATAQPAQPDLAARVAALEAEVALLRADIKARPIWTEDRFKASVIEVIDAHVFLKLERVR